MGLFGKKKSAKISGEYFGSHPSISGHHVLTLEASENGISVRKKKDELLFITWDNVLGFDYEAQDSTVSDSRTSLTRVAAFGVLGLAAKKKQTKVNVKIVSVLTVKDGEIVLENAIKDSGISSTASSMAQSYATMLETNNKKFKIFVADHRNSVRS